MTVEEISRGESNHIEFKVRLPERSEVYTRTIVAFANTQGGQLIIGVDDSTREVVGIDESEHSVFEIMDRISNAVSDSCTPQIMPDIEPQTVDGRTVIVVTVLPGGNRPYYIRSKGKENGTYIRVGGTTRPAYPEKIKELEMEGAHVSWDECVCIGYEVTDQAKDALCSDIIRYREKAGLPRREVTETQLVNWKLIQSAGGSESASNAFVLLTSDYFPFSKTQCAVFKGTGRSIFLDKREFVGPIYKQIEEAVDFVLRNTRLGAEIHGLLRRESYELPVAAIREMIINAHCHRNLMAESCVQVSIYDDRLEVTSPGGLYNGLTYEQLMNGHSRIRNRVIANVLNQMGLVESWGTGIARIQDAAAAKSLPEPEFLVYDDMFRVNLFRLPAEHRTSVQADRETDRETVREAVGTDRETNTEVAVTDRETSTEPNPTDTDIGIKISGREIILAEIQKNPQTTMAVLAEKTGLSYSGVRYIIRQLQKENRISRIGSTKKGQWIIVNGNS